MSGSVLSLWLGVLGQVLRGQLSRVLCGRFLPSVPGRLSSSLAFKFPSSSSCMCVSASFLTARGDRPWTGVVVEAEFCSLAHGPLPGPQATLQSPWLLCFPISDLASPPTATPPSSDGPRLPPGPVSQPHKIPAPLPVMRLWRRKEIYTWSVRETWSLNVGIYKSTEVW